MTPRSAAGTLQTMTGESDTTSPSASSALAASSAFGAKLTYVGHATVLIEMDGVRVLTDPLLRRNLGPLLRHGKMPDLAAIRDVDAILISHAHIDHLDLGSLRRLDRTARILVPRGCGSTVERIGFAAVDELDIGDVFKIGKLTVRATAADHATKRTPLKRLGLSMGLVVDGSQSIYFAGDTGLFSDMDEIG